MKTYRDLTREHLPAPVKRLLRRILPRLADSRHWQHHRAEGTRQRWKLISASLGPDDRTLLDVGCNTGLLTAAAADHGLIALGLDMMPAAIESAIARGQGRERLAFMCWDIPVDGIAALPTFDVVLLLSVYHQWVARYGDDVARRMLALLIEKARSRFYFEPASIRSKYGRQPPPIHDLDKTSIIDVNAQLLRDVSRNGSVRYMGATPTIGEEAFRCLFVLEPNT